VPPRRPKIVDAARSIFVEAGEAAVTMRAVAARAEVSPMAAYRHFESREALMQAVMERGHDAFLRRMHHALAAPGPPSASPPPAGPTWTSRWRTPATTR
jgi:AcrR family transcriptional regulator